MWRYCNLVFFPVRFDLKWLSWIGVPWQFSWEENPALNRKIKFQKIETFSFAYRCYCCQLILLLPHVIQNHNVHIWNHVRPWAWGRLDWRVKFNFLICLVKNRYLYMKKFEWKMIVFSLHLMMSEIWKFWIKWEFVRKGKYS